MSIDTGTSGFIRTVRSPDCLFENAIPVSIGSATADQKERLRNREGVRGNVGRKLCDRTGCLQECMVKVDEENHVEVVGDFEDLLRLGQGCLQQASDASTTSNPLY